MHLSTANISKTVTYGTSNSVAIKYDNGRGLSKRKFRVDLDLF